MPSRGGLAAVLVAAALILGPVSAEGQRLPERSYGFGTVEPVRGLPAPEGRRAFAYSLVLPGAGQYAAGSRRWVAYAALEAWSWYRYADRRHEGRSLERGYRDLAWEVARQHRGGPRQDGDFAYYEAMSRYAESGAFDRDPSRPELWPETDEGTYNGSVWALARAIYFPAGIDEPARDSPEYRRALEYYQRRAVTEVFAWSWTGSGSRHEAYRELIRESDAAFRSATTALGLILANHFVSAVDALITTRLYTAEGGAPPLHIESQFDLGGAPPALRVGVRWSRPRR